jgi:hypothetical protein
MKPKLERLRLELGALETENQWLAYAISDSMAVIKQANTRLILNGQARIDTAAAIEAIEKKKERKRAEKLKAVSGRLGGPE